MIKSTDKKAVSSKELQPEEIITAFMQDTLEKSAYPVSEYLFCKTHGFDEAKFYSHFGNLNQVSEAVWLGFFKNTIDLLHKNTAYTKFETKEKLLTFYFTFFEVLNLNRSYALFALQKCNGSQNPIEKLKDLKPLRAAFKAYCYDLQQDADTKNTLVKKPVRLLTEGAWIQLFCILQFWVKDSSPGFEKTDMVIEKSVQTIFDIIDHTPLESAIDFGKFIWKEILQ